jgi:hypothetical protein
VLALVVAACSGRGPAPSTPTAPIASAVATASASAPPAETPGATPPDALLSVDGGAVSRGEIGTYTWLGTGTDAPWLPGTPLKAASGGAASVTLAPPAPSTTWTVRIARPGDTQGSTARAVAEGSGPIQFTVPAGGGSLLVHVDFAANAGDANWFWSLSP